MQWEPHSAARTRTESRQVDSKGQGFPRAPSYAANAGVVDHIKVANFSAIVKLADAITAYGVM
ncbi:MAG: hypothetical protein ACE5KS_02870 [Woeseiaceae bacterium]